MIFLANFIYTGIVLVHARLYMKIIPILLAAAALSACTTVPTPAPAEDAESAKMLETAIKRAENSSKGTASADAKPREAVMAGGNITINYAGEAKTLLRQFAAARSLSFRVLGPQPHLPLFVIVDVKDATLEYVMTDIGAQFGQRADLVLKNDSIEVRYRD